MLNDGPEIRDYIETLNLPSCINPHLKNGSAPYPAVKLWKCHIKQGKWDSVLSVSSLTGKNCYNEDSTLGPLDEWSSALSRD
jgi:hypothetical protein